MQSRTTRRCRQRGIATIEFAICTPILFFLMLGTAEVGRLLFQYNTLVKTVRDGARHAANRARTPARVISITPELTTQTHNLVVTGNINGTGGELLPGLAGAFFELVDAGNGFVSVTVSYEFESILGTLPTFGFGDSIDLSMTLPATVVMRAL